MNNGFYDENGIHRDLPRTPENASLFESHIDWETEEKELTEQEKKKNKK